MIVRNPALLDNMRDEMHGEQTRRPNLGTDELTGRFSDPTKGGVGESAAPGVGSHPGFSKVKLALCYRHADDEETLSPGRDGFGVSGALCLDQPAHFHVERCEHVRAVR